MLLHIQHYKDSFFALPSEKQAELLMGMLAFADKYVKNGKMKASYTFSDVKGIASIWDDASAEEWMRISLEYPMSPYIEVEMIPVVEYKASVKITTEWMGATPKTAKK